MKSIIFNAIPNWQKFLTNFISAIGSLKAGIIDLCRTCKVGENSIKYFEEYVKKIMYCEFVIKGMKNMKKPWILDILPKNNFENFKINIVK